jgi:hypothetical protein
MKVHSYFIFILLFLMAANSFSQLLQNNETKSAVLLSLPDVNGYASGLIYSDYSNIYLITAKHVLFPEEGDSLNTSKLNSMKIICSFYRDDPNSGVKRDIEIDVYSAYTEGAVSWNPSVDIAAIKLGINAKYLPDSTAIIDYYSFVKRHKSSAIVTVRRSDIITYDEIQVGNEVFVIGYPISLNILPPKHRQYDYDRPLIRRAIISGKYIDHHTFIVDCPIYPGNSDGPVITNNTPSNVLTATPIYKFIGIMTEFVPCIDTLTDPKNSSKTVYRMNSGYSVIVSIDQIFDYLK